jgi:hypothetical protein
MIQKPRKSLVKHIKQHGKKRGILWLIPLLYNLIISKMKNTYIVAIKDKDTLEPRFIQARVWEDITWIWRTHYRAYIFESKKKADEVFLDWYKNYEEKQKLLTNNQ